MGRMALPSNAPSSRSRCTIRARHTPPSIGYHALVDSGADHCVFSAEIADMLEIDIMTGEAHAMSGAVAGEARPVSFFTQLRSRSVRTAASSVFRSGLASCRSCVAPAMVSSAGTVFSTASRS
jgi:hypothetical protein